MNAEPEADYAENSSSCDYNSTVAPQEYTVYITFVSSCLSMTGSALIILTYILWRDIRSVARAIVVFLAIADFFTAAGYLFGVIVNYLNRRDHFNPELYRYLCESQSFITTAFPISSFLWTIHLAVYLYVAIVNAKPNLAKRLVIFFHISGWGIPLLICVPALVTSHLGGSNGRTSVNWCFIYFNNTNPDDSEELKRRLVEYYGFEFLCGKFWEISASFIAVFLYISVKVVLKKRMNKPVEVVRSAYGSVNLERRITAAMIHLDQKLIFIPLVFIFLRFWGTLRFFLSFQSSCHYPCDDKLIVTGGCKTALYNPILLVMQAACDPGQGWGNALIFVIFHKTLFKRLCPCLFYASQKISDCLQNRSFRKNRRSESPAVNYSSERKESPLINDEDDGHHTPLLSDECDRTQISFQSSISSSRM